MNSDTRPTVSFVIPACNEESNIEEVVRRALAVLDRDARDGEVVVVNDGSRDSTGTIMDRLAAEFPGQVRTITHPAPIGCHPSMWRGSLSARAEWIFFIPADKQIIPEELPKFLAASGNLDLVCSYRRRRADQWYRRVVGRVYNRLERYLLDLPLDDTHSSVLIRKSLVEALAPSIRSTSAVLPIEIAARAMYRGFRIGQIEIDHYPRVAGVATGITSMDILRLPGDLLKFTVELRAIRRGTRSLASPAEVELATPTHAEHTAGQ